MKKRLSPVVLRDYPKLLAPLLLYPAAYFPYRLWGIGPFANLARFVVYGGTGNPMWTVFHVQVTILYFWLCLSVVVMLISVVWAMLRIRPWYFITLYIQVMISLCGVLTLAFYKIMA